ncbi:MAG: hypothetical protein WAN59_15140 [Candidatus Baltobacteraceae bacterium]
MSATIRKADAGDATGFDVGGAAGYLVFVWLGIGSFVVYETPEVAALDPGRSAVEPTPSAAGTPAPLNYACSGNPSVSVSRETSRTEIITEGVKGLTHAKERPSS